MRTIKQLSQKEYQGFPLHVRYQTKQYYDIEVLSMGFQLIQKEYDQPKQHMYEDVLFSDWLEAPIAFGLFEDDQLLGIIEGNMESWHSIFRITNVFIEEAYRRLGIGSTLMKHMITYVLHNLEVRGIMLETQTCNVPAIQLYQSFGFELCAIHTHEYSNDDLQRKEARLDFILVLSNSHSLK